MQLTTRVRLGRLGGALGAVMALWACTPDPIVTPVRNLERPSDLAFACVEVTTPEGETPVLVTGRPMRTCHDPSFAPKATPQSERGNPQLSRAARFQDRERGPRRRGTFGFVTNTARGEVAVVDFDSSGLVDLDLKSPGFNQLPVGTLPEAVTTSTDGCQAVTANRGTCDLSLIDVPAVVARQFGARSVTADAGLPATRTVKIKSGGVDLRAQPREITFLPAAEAAMCAAEAPGEIIVTFPRCGLVALVSLPSGEIRSSVRILADGSVVDAGSSPTCAPECNPSGSAGAPLADAGSDAAADAGLPPAGDAVAPAEVGEPLPTGPGAVIAGLAVMPDTSRLFVGLASGSVISAVGIAGAPGGRQLTALPNGRTVLAEDAVGVARLRLSVDPFGDPAEGLFVGQQGKFLYGFARDGSVRVLDVDRLPAVECDVNIEGIGPTEPCVPLSSMRKRRLFLRGPGIRVPVNLQPDVAPPVPIDIAFAQVGERATGFLLTSNGQVMHIGLGLSRRPLLEGEGERAPDLDPIHSFRQAEPNFANSRGGGPVIAALEPNRNFSATDVAFATRVSFAGRNDGPRLESWAENVMGSVVDTRWAWSGRPQHEVPPENVTISWEGALPEALRITGRLEAVSPDDADDGLIGALGDNGANFCRAGVLVGDVVALVGCAQDADCDPLRDEVCHRAAPGAPGVCIKRAMVSDETLMRTCRQEFSSRRRYIVKEVNARRLMLGLKLDEVPRPALATCNPANGGDDPVCQPDAAHKQNMSVPGDRAFSCQTVGAQPRCVKSCAVMGADGMMRLEDSLCRPGHVCAEVGAPGGPLCVEAPTPKPECFTGTIRYRVHTGGWRVHTSSLPEFITQREGQELRPGSGGRCEAIENLDPRLQNRLSLSAPPCPEGPSEALPLGSFLKQRSPMPNPCFLRGPNNDDTRQAAIKAFIETPHLRFMLTNLEDYVGDAGAIGLSVTGGQSPLLVLRTRSGSDPVLGARILTGPMASGTVANTPVVPVPPYVFVIDQGRTLSDLSRGQLLRLNPRPWRPTFIGGYFDSGATDTTWPIQ